MLDHKILMLLSSFFASVVFFFASSPTHQGPALAAKELALFDSFVRQVCLALDPSDASWEQAQPSLSHGGHGLRLLALHSLAAYIASPSTSDTSCFTIQLIICLLSLTRQVYLLVSASHSSSGSLLCQPLASAYTLILKSAIQLSNGGLAWIHQQGTTT